MTRDLLDHNLRFNNVVPIVFSAITISISSASVYFSVINRISLVEQKIDTIINQQQEVIKNFDKREAAEDARYTNLATRVGTNSIRLTKLETIDGIK